MDLQFTNLTLTRHTRTGFTAHPGATEGRKSKHAKAGREKRTRKRELHAWIVNVESLSTNSCEELTMQRRFEKSLKHEIDLTSHYMSI